MEWRSERAETDRVEGGGSEGEIGGRGEGIGRESGRETGQKERMRGEG